MDITYQFSENSRYIIVTTFKNRKPVTKTIADKLTGSVVVEVYKEGVKTPVESYVYNKTV